MTVERHIGRSLTNDAEADFSRQDANPAMYASKQPLAPLMQCALSTSNLKLHITVIANSS